MECDPRCWRNRYRQGKRWPLELCLVEARWPDSMTVKEEKRAVVAHGVACAPAQREFDAVTVVNLLYDEVHAVSVLRESGVFVVLGERSTNVRDHFYSRKIHAVAVPHEFGVFVLDDLDERQTNVQDDCYSCEVQVLRARRLEMEKE